MKLRGTTLTKGRKGNNSGSVSQNKSLKKNNLFWRYCGFYFMSEVNKIVINISVSGALDIYLSVKTSGYINVHTPLNFDE